MKGRVSAWGLRCGIAVPIVYFGLQAIAVPFFPGYNLLSMIASILGSDQAPHPAIFNIGAAVVGWVTIGAAVGFLLGLRAIGASAVWLWLTSLAVLLNGLGSIWASLHPLPDPQHGAGPFPLGILLFPLLLVIAIWKLDKAGAMKVYLIVAMLVGLAIFFGMAGAFGPTRGYEGLLQRLLALAFFPPIAVGAAFVMKRTAS